jgi:hypothetical protein
MHDASQFRQEAISDRERVFCSLDRSAQCTKERSKSNLQCGLRACLIAIGSGMSVPNPTAWIAADPWARGFLV